MCFSLECYWSSNLSREKHQMSNQIKNQMSDLGNWHQRSEKILQQAYGNKSMNDSHKVSDFLDGDLMILIHKTCSFLDTFESCAQSFSSSSSDVLPHLTSNSLHHFCRSIEISQMLMCTLSQKVCNTGPDADGVTWHGVLIYEGPMSMSRTVPCSINRSSLRTFSSNFILYNRAVISVRKP